MATILQLRRGTTVQHSSFTGALGEVTVDTTKDTIVVHDGSTAGGFALAKESDISGFITLSDISGGTGLDYNSSTGVFDIDSTVATKTYVDTAVAGKDNTDEITEGSTNLYFTNARARSAISVTDSGGDGSLAYNSTTGAITYTGPSASDVRAHFSAGTGITITSGAIAVDSTIATKSYADSAATTAVAAVIDAAPAALDTLNELAAALGDDANFSTTITNSIATKLASADFDSTADTWLATKDTDNVTEGTTNLFYTNTRARAALSAGTGISYDSATGAISVSNGVYTTDTGTVTNTMLAGSIANAKLANSAITLAGTSVSLGGAFTATNMLDAIKTVDGSGSGLDADLLDGNSSAYYRINIYDASGTLLN
jgi:hypothetical protein